MAAARARTISDGPSATDVSSGLVGPTRIADTPARRPATVHTRSETRATGTPASSAASAFSADARLAMPTFVRLRKADRPTSTTGEISRISSWPADTK